MVDVSQEFLIKRKSSLLKKNKFKKNNFKKNTFKKKMGAVKTSSIEITKCHSRENKSWKFCETHLHSKNFYSISCLCKEEKFLEIDENEKVLQYILKGRIFSKFAPDFLSGFREMYTLW